ncbi:hypothetical protein [Promicromonospora sp. NFX87]|uniref:hypothetical protein n=1 Tax=Promicromonospora sp. NFX87 TaxID=3402691 RepID=UPI003AFA380E
MDPQRAPRAPDRGERAEATRQLSLFGRSPAAIAKRLGTSREEVDAALVVAEAPKVLEALAAAPAMDLLAAAKLAEFADDEDVFADLSETASEEPESLDHELAWARQNRAVKVARAERIAELEASGVRVDVDDAGGSLWDLSATPATVSSTPSALTVEEHATCPYRAVHVSARWGGGEVEVTVGERCMDWEAAGHHKRYDRPQADPAEKSAERKNTLKQNAAADAAQEVRRRFISDHLLWERDPKGRMTKVRDGTVQHVAAVVAQSSTGLDYEARTLLDEWERGKTLPPPGSSRVAAERSLLRRVLAIGESTLPRTFWRSHHYAGNYSMAGGAPVAVQHLRQLETWGYGLAPVEREYLQAWDDAVTKYRETEAKRAAERDAEAVTP